MRIREGEGRMWCDGEWYRRFEMPGGRDGIRGSWDTEMDLGEMAYRDGDGISELRDCAPGKSGNTTIGERTKCIRQRRSSTHTPPLSHHPSTWWQQSKERRKIRLRLVQIYKYTPPSIPTLRSPLQPPPQLIPKHKHPIRRQRRQRHGDRLAPLERARDRRPAQHHRRQEGELDAERLGVLDAHAAEGVWSFQR